LNARGKRGPNLADVGFRKVGESGAAHGFWHRPASAEAEPVQIWCKKLLATAGF